jgi:hypothetical protein
MVNRNFDNTHFLGRDILNDMWNKTKKSVCATVRWRQIKTGTTVTRPSRSAAAAARPALSGRRDASG